MGDTAPDGAAVAHRAVGNPARNASQHPARKIRDAAILDIGVGDAGADRQRLAVSSTCVNSAMPVRSTSTSGCASRRLSMGPSDPPAMNFTIRSLRAASAIAAAVSVGHSYSNRAGFTIGPAPRWPAGCRGVIGDTSNSAPSGRSASLMALAIAAGGAMAPPSPIPFTPNSCIGRERLHMIEGRGGDFGRSGQ